MMIHISKDIEPHYIYDFLTFNSIPFLTHTLWDTQEKKFVIPQGLTDSILIIDCCVLLEISKVRSSWQELIGFCNGDNRLWLFGTHDHALSFTKPNIRDLLQSFIKQVPENRVLCILEGEFSDRFYLMNLANVQVLFYKNVQLEIVPRVSAKTMIKTQPRHDYLLTMRLKKGRAHRDLLWNAINNRPFLSQRGLVTCRNSDDSPWLGKISAHHDHNDGHPSMDLYLDSCVEIVPETCYRDVYYFTEKSWKPIATKTPFLMVSTMGYLDYLHDMGFKTFGSLIDEKYDKFYRVEDRIDTMLDQLENIIQNGAYDFYRAAGPILDHNFSRLCEIAGSWQHEFDQMMWQALDLTHQK